MTQTARSQFFKLLQISATIGLVIALTGCLDFGVDDHIYVCRAQKESNGSISHDCGAEAACLRGPGCYCICKPLGASGDLSCKDPACQLLPAGQPCSSGAECESNLCSGGVCLTQ